MKRTGRSAWKKIRVAAAATVGAGLVLCGLIVLDGLRDDARPSDVAVVLGNKVNPDGRPSLMLQARLDQALALYRRGLFRNVVVSGGVGREGYDEAEVMKAYLAARGVPERAIITDNKGVNTRATAINTVALMRRRGWSSCLVITQYFHAPRSRLALRQAGVRQVSSGPARYFAVRDVYSIPREVAGYAVYLLRPGGPDAQAPAG